jgi:TRAP-type C4-dicarboxylate transport system permease small subunit
VNTSDKTVATGFFRKVWLVAHRVLTVISIALLFSMMLLTCIDVVARYAFNSPVKGAFELTEILLASLIFAALPLTTKAGEHIRVEFLEDIANTTMSTLLNRFSALVMCTVFCVFAIELWKHAVKLDQRGTVTNSLEIPIAGVGYFAAVSSALCALVALAFMVRRSPPTVDD